jgi:hypothetical protein
MGDRLFDLINFLHFARILIPHAAIKGSAGLLLLDSSPLFEEKRDLCALTLIPN